MEEIQKPALEIPADNATPRKPYEKPEVVFERPLEAMAAVCTPAPPGKALGGLNCSIASS